MQSYFSCCVLMRAVGCSVHCNELVHYLVEESQASSFPALLQGLPTQFLEEARDDARFTTIVLQTNRAARLRIISILWISFLKCWSQTAQAYSSCGRTRDLYAVSLNSNLQFQRFLRSRLNVLFDLHITLWMWPDEERLSLMVTPRYE